jgi:hypothetical protein
MYSDAVSKGHTRVEIQHSVVKRDLRVEGPGLNRQEQTTRSTLQRADLDEEDLDRTDKHRPRQIRSSRMDVILSQTQRRHCETHLLKSFLFQCSVSGQGWRIKGSVDLVPTTGAAEEVIRPLCLRLEPPAFDCLVRLGCAMLDACLENKNYEAGYNLLSANTRILYNPIYGRKACFEERHKPG